MSEKIRKNQECVQDHHFDTPYRFPGSPTPQTRFPRKSSLVSFLRWKLEHFSRQDHLGYNLVNLPIWALKAIRSTYPTLIIRFLSLFGVDSVWKNIRLLPKQFQLITQEYWWRILSSSRCKTSYPRSQYRYGDCLDSFLWDRKHSRSEECSTVVLMEKDRHHFQSGCYALKPTNRTFCF